MKMMMRSALVLLLDAEHCSLLGKQEAYRFCQRHHRRCRRPHPHALAAICSRILLAQRPLSSSWCIRISNSEDMQTLEKS